MKRQSFKPKKKVVYSVREHAKLRAKQRYGIELNKAFRKECEEKIQSKSSTHVFCIERESRTRTRFLILLSDNTIIHCIYSNTFKTLVTVLSIQWIPKNLRAKSQEWIDSKQCQDIKASEV